MFRVWLICLAISGCAQKNIDPAALGIQFTGQWPEAPDVRVGVAKKNHNFLLRITGYVPHEAEHIIIRDEFGTEMTSLPIQWLDAGQTAPQRKYYVTWALAESDFHYIVGKQSGGGEKMSFLNSNLSGTGIRLRAEIHTQDERILAQHTLRVNISCMSCGI